MTPTFTRAQQVGRARALLNRIDQVEVVYGHALNREGWKLLTHSAFSAWLDLRALGEPVRRDESGAWS